MSTNFDKIVHRWMRNEKMSGYNKKSALAEELLNLAIAGKDKIKISSVINMIEGLQPADVAPVVHGRWIPNIPQKQERITRSPLAINWYCSECKTEGSPHWKRCPVCEAKMELEIDHG